VLDASALLALVFNEPGADRVRSCVDGARVSAINHSEALARMLSRGSALEESRRHLARLPIEIMAFDAAQATLCASLHARTPGLSFGDRACLALALTLGLPVLTGDRLWKELDIGAAVETFR
jgi:PIN domain nuclease of toxin-antitoxin system